MLFEIEPFATYVREIYAVSEQSRQDEIKRMEELGTPWPTYNSPLRQYEESFALIKDKPFAQILSERKDQKGKVFALDIMGTARFSSIFPVDGEMAMTLIDFRSEEVKAEDFKNKREVADGNIVLSKPWLRAKEFIKKHDDTDLPGFDLITCRPIGGWGSLFDTQKANLRYSRIVQHILVQRAASLLSPEGGVLFVQLPPEDNYDQLKKLLAITPELSVFDNEYPDNKIKIVRESKNPVRLPKPWVY